MPLREEIIRGLRIGSILLIVLLLGYTVYRVVQILPGSAVASAPDTQPAPESARTPGRVAKGSAAVPPPPPRGRRLSVTPAVQPSMAQSASSPETPAEPVDVAPVVTQAETKAPEPAAVPTVASNEPSAPERVTEDGPDPYESRSRRALKAVGRFFHFGKKDSASQAIRQQ